MRLSFTRLFCLLGGLVGAHQVASAQTTYTPAAVTGYTADVIANGIGPVANSTTATVDRGVVGVRWCFANTTFVNPAGASPTQSLPASGLINSATTAGLTFQMASASDNNSLRIDGNGMGTLSLVTPQPASEVMVLATEGNGSTAGKTFIVSFTDNTSQTFTNVAVPDWFNGASPAVIVGSRVNRDDNTIDNQTSNPRIYEVRLTLSNANYGKLIKSVTVSKTSTDPVLNVMGISLGANCLGVPVGGTAVAAPTSVCPGTQVALGVTGATISGGITYQWQASTNGGTTFTNIAGATGASYVATPAVTTQYRVVLTCSQQSGTSTVVTVTVNTTPATVTYAAPPALATFCQRGTQAVVTATPAGGTFSVSAGTGLSLSATTGTLNLGASTAGTYTVTYTPPAGSCASPATTTVTVVAPVVPTLTYPTTGSSICTGGASIAPTVVAPAGGTFSGSAGLVINPTTGVVNPAQTPAGTYTVTYTTAGACSASTTYSLTIQPAPTVTLTFNGTDFCKSGAVPTAVATPAGGTFSSTAGLAIDQTTGVIDYGRSTNGTYTVTYAISGPCPGQASATLTIKGNEKPTYPSVLTPNGDTKNDVLKLKIADVQNYSLQVFNRWGRRVYEGHSANEGWDPSADSAGIYYYLLEYTDCAGRPQREQTWLEVIK